MCSEPLRYYNVYATRRCVLQLCTGCNAAKSMVYTKRLIYRKKFSKVILRTTQNK